ncbi:hypothetical protein GCK32_017128 [Trichostrongylus colubriformis]|uniref:Uncharacterized protein n=1 Tax=Trichostrongylus colubriformis TaxID=6319 RepID=A0AAN8G036_TRICO
MLFHGSPLYGTVRTDNLRRVKHFPQMTRWPFLHLIRLILRRLVSIRSYIHSYIFSISFKVIQIWRRNTLIKVVTAAASFYLLYSLYVAIKAYLELSISASE